jgi:hypothetical protein
MPMQAARVVRRRITLADWSRKHAVVLLEKNGKNGWPSST